MGSGGLGTGWGRALAARRWDACFSLVLCFPGDLNGAGTLSGALGAGRREGRRCGVEGGWVGVGFVRGGLDK